MDIIEILKRDARRFVARYDAELDPEKRRAMHREMLPGETEEMLDKIFEGSEYHRANRLAKAQEGK